MLLLLICWSQMEMFMYTHIPASFPSYTDLKKILFAFRDLSWNKIRRLPTVIFSHLSDLIAL